MRALQNTDNKARDTDELIAQIEEIMNELESAESVFNAAPDDDAAEAAIYRIMSLSACRGRLLTLAKRQDLFPAETVKD